MNDKQTRALRAKIWKRLAEYTSKDATRPALTHIRFERDPDRAIATDGTRMIIVQGACAALGLTFHEDETAMHVPARMFLPLLADGAAVVQSEYGVTCGDIYERFSDRFPDWTRVAPADDTLSHSLDLDVAGWVAALADVEIDKWTAADKVKGFATGKLGWHVGKNETPLFALSPESCAFRSSFRCREEADGPAYVEDNHTIGAWPNLPTKERKEVTDAVAIDWRYVKFAAGDAGALRVRWEHSQFPVVCDTANLGLQETHIIMPINMVSH